VFLLTTGSESTEAAIKLSRVRGQGITPGKFHILSFYNSFHGRTMGAQAAGGYMDAQQWMVEPPPGFHHIPFPEPPDYPDDKADDVAYAREFLELSLEQIRREGFQDDLCAGVMSETFLGPTVVFMPNGYARALRQWCDEHQALMIFDEMQAGFGRTGKWFGFEHYGIEPDLICLGKGMTSSLPMSALVGRREVMDLPGHGEMSSTHTGNPLCCAATLGNIAALRDEGLVENAAALGLVAQECLGRLRERFPRHVTRINGRGLAWAVYLVDPDTKVLDPALSDAVTARCMELGLIMLKTMRGTLKIAPPLCITEAAFREGLDVIEEVLAEFIG
jgi:4-aminobutyrate aminotransferase/diaminobutyrate-pyruvate transaminase/4-aminobutyrate aminotransferase/(S)-3-amino-2-methylpropionate transaminase